MFSLAITALLSGSSDPAALAVLALGAGVYLFYRGFRRLQRKRLIANTPTSKVRSASIGLVEVNGHAIGPYTIRSPLCLEPCYYYKAIAWQLRSSGKSKEWKKAAEEALHMPFFVDDGTGRVLVDPRGAEMDIHRDFHSEYHRGTLSTDPVPEAVRHFLACHGVSTDSSIRVDEYLIRPGAPLFVLGTLAENPGLEVKAMPMRDLPSAKLQIVQARMAAAVQASQTAEMVAGRNQLSRDEREHLFRQQVAAAMGFQGLDKLPPGFPGKLVAAQVAAQNAGGARPRPAPQISDEEKHRRDLFTAALFGAAMPSVANTGGEVAPAAEVKPEDFELHPPTVLMKGERDRTFFISYRSQRELLSQLEWEATACIVGGPILTLIALAYLLARFNSA
jgi:hypothetical protein